MSILTGTGWENTEFRSYTFRSLEDENASVVETPESRRRRNHNKALSQDEQRELRATAEKSWTDSGFTSSQTKL